MFPQDSQESPDQSLSPEKSQWLAMVYLAGDNNLSTESVFALTEMEKVGSDKELFIIAQLDSGIHDGTPLIIRGDTEPGGISNRLLQAKKDKQKVNGSQPKALIGGSTAKSDQNGLQKQKSHFVRIVEFVEGCKATCEAENYLLVLSGHGDGSVGDFLKDDDSESLSVPTLGDLLAEVKERLGVSKLDIVGLDSCLMSMTEVAHQIREHAEVMIGAEGFEPSGGWPYESVFRGVKKIINDPAAKNGDDLEALAKSIVGSYIGYYTNYQAAGVSVDQAACRLSESETLTRAVKRLSEILQEHLPEGEPNQAVRNALVISHWEAQPYKSEQYTDLYDFCSLLKENCAENDVRRACQNVMNSIRGSGPEGAEAATADPDFQAAKGFILKSCYSGLTVQHSRGVSIYFPWAENAAELAAYEKLEFPEASGWAKFLKAYLRATQRRPRAGTKGAEPQTFDPEVPSVLLTDNFFAAGHKNGSMNKNGSENKNGSMNKNIGRMPGSMRNPPTVFFPCEDCVEKTKQEDRRTGKPVEAPAETRAATSRS